MHSRLLPLAAVALLSVFIAVSTPCQAAEEGAQAASDATSTPAAPPAQPGDSSPRQETSPAGRPAGGASTFQDEPDSTEEKVGPEEVPPSEE